MGALVSGFDTANHHLSKKTFPTQREEEQEVNCRSRRDKDVRRGEGWIFFFDRNEDCLSNLRTCVYILSRILAADLGPGLNVLKWIFLLVAVQNGDVHNLPFRILPRMRRVWGRRWRKGEFRAASEIGNPWNFGSRR